MVALDIEGPFSFRGWLKRPFLGNSELLNQKKIGIPIQNPSPSEELVTEG